MIILMGIAGSGKGTQGKLLTEKFGLEYISTGEILRAHASEAQKQRMHVGELLNDTEIIAMVQEVIGASPDPGKILFDGFPRTIAQAEWLLGKTEELGMPHPSVFHLLASKEAVKARLDARARTDDHDAAIEERFREYETATLALVQWLTGHGVKIFEVDGERAVEAVQADLVRLFQETA